MKKVITTLQVILLSTFLNSQNYWQQSNGPDGGYIMSIVKNQNEDLFAATEGAGVYRSTDNGNSWFQVNDTYYFVSSLLINQSGHVFVGTYAGIYRSTDNGISWIPVNNGLTYFVIK